MSPKVLEADRSMFELIIDEECETCCVSEETFLAHKILSVLEIKYINVPTFYAHY